jgi:hypothetical protein
LVDRRRAGDHVHPGRHFVERLAGLGGTGTSRALGTFRRTPTVRAI